MVTYGFYNSVDHDRTYDATQVSELFDGLIREGVYEFIGQRFAVSALSSGFQVSVGTGRAWFNHTWTKNDAELVLTLPAPPTEPKRYRCDAIVLDINSDIKVRENKITYVSGEESANENPPHPSLLTGTHYQVPLAWIKRVGREENILQANINYVVGTSVCPYVVGVLQEVDITAHVAEWEDAWNQWFNTKTAGWDEELAAAEAAIENATSDVTEEVAEFRVWVASQKSQFDGWMDDSKNDFDAWFANLQYILDGDVAGHLQNEIDTLGNRITPIENGGTGNKYGYIRTGQKKSGTTIGEFATAEGMNTISSGKCAHSEGAGDYSYTYQDEHLQFDGNYYRYAEDQYPIVILKNPCPTIEGANYNDYLPNTKIYTYESSGDTYQTWHTASGMRSVSCAIILRDLTDDVILKHEEVNLDVRDNSSKFITNYSTNEYCYAAYFNPDHILDIRDTYSNIYDYDTGEYNLRRNTGKAIWYMDGDTVEDSNIVIHGSFVIITSAGGSPSTGFSPYIDRFDRVLIDPSTEEIDKARSFGCYYTSSQSYPDYPIAGYATSTNIYVTTSASNTHTYKLELYYSYTLVSEDENIDHKIVWVPAGEILTIGSYPAQAIGDYSHVEGKSTIATGNYAHAEGIGGGDYVDQTKNPGAHGDGSHAEGYKNYANGHYSHAEGIQNKTEGLASHVSGAYSESAGDYSFVHGRFAKAYGEVQFLTGTDWSNYNMGPISDDMKKIRSIVFGIETYSDYTDVSKDQTMTQEPLKKVNENKNGVSLLMLCPTTTDSISYKIIMPNDIFATYFEMLEIIDGDPINQYKAYSGRIIKLYPNGQSDCGFLEAVKLFDINSATNNIDYPTPATIYVDGTPYKYPIIKIQNTTSVAVSTNTKNVYIKYTLMRIM